MTQTAHGPITSAPLRVRPPYDQRDIAGNRGKTRLSTSGGTVDASTGWTHCSRRSGALT
jgi:hypothetical protein